MWTESNVYRVHFIIILMDKHTFIPFVRSEILAVFINVYKFAVKIDSSQLSVEKSTIFSTKSTDCMTYFERSFCQTWKEGDRSQLITIIKGIHSNSSDASRNCDFIKWGISEGFLLNSCNAFIKYDRSNLRIPECISLNCSQWTGKFNDHHTLVRIPFMLYDLSIERILHSIVEFNRCSLVVRSCIPKFCGSRSLRNNFKSRHRLDLISDNVDGLVGLLGICIAINISYGNIHTIVESYWRKTEPELCGMVSIRSECYSCAIIAAI